MTALLAQTVADRATGSANVRRVATVQQCRAALETLGERLRAVDPDVRARHLPDRSVSCRIRDLDVTFAGRLGPDGVQDLRLDDPAESKPADVRLTLSSDELVALAERPEEFVSSWLRGRVQVSAAVRDLLRLRTLLGL